MKKLINEYTLSALAFISTIIGIEIVFNLFRSSMFLEFIKGLMYGL